MCDMVIRFKDEKVVLTFKKVIDSLMIKYAPLWDEDMDENGGQSPERELVTLRMVTRYADMVKVMKCYTAEGWMIADWKFNDPDVQQAYDNLMGWDINMAVSGKDYGFDDGYWRKGSDGHGKKNDDGHWRKCSEEGMMIRVDDAKRPGEGRKE